MLAIYLHHDGSVLSNVFCSQLLCSESIVSYLTSNFIVWGWDITFSSNQNRYVPRQGPPAIRTGTYRAGTVSVC